MLRSIRYTVNRDFAFESMYNPKKRKLTNTPYRIVRPSQLTKVDFSRDVRAMRRGYSKPIFLGENKFLDLNYSETAIPSSATQVGGEADPSTVNCLNAIAQGDGESDRDGRKIVVNSVYIQGIVRIKPDFDPTLSNLNAVAGFVALVQDTQTNGAQLNSEDVFTNPGGTTESGFPLQNLKFSKRFKVLKVKRFTLVPPGIGYKSTATEGYVGAAALYRFKIWKDLNMPVIHTSTTANVTDIGDNSLHVIAFANRTGAELNYSSRVRFRG